VSDFHARIEEVDGQLAVRDLNSKNGIYVRPNPQSSPMRVAPQEAVPLRLHGFEFFVGPYLRIHVQAIAAGHDETLRDLKAQGAVLGNPQMMAPHEAAGPIMPSATPGYGAAVVPVYPQASAYPQPAQATPGYPAATPYARPPSSPPPPMAPTPAPAAARAPSAPPYGSGAAIPPEFAPTQSSSGGAGAGAAEGRAGAPAGYPAPVARSAAPPAAPVHAGSVAERGNAPMVKGTAHFSITPESLALVGLRELATSLVPGLPLETTGDIARLVTKLHDTVEVFCRSFIPLRESHAQFAASRDLQRASEERSLNRSSAYLALERARDPGAVARALLDWRDPSLDAPSAVENIFADLVVYQTALLDGVMNGVRALLEELSPNHVEQLQDERRAVGVHLALGRYKALWESYTQLHQAVEDQEEVFARLFGAEFAAAYRERRQRRLDASNTGRAEQP
jgi:hypothetical protein